MLSYFNAAVNGQWLSEIDENVYVIDIRDHPKEQMESTARTMASGSRFIRQTRKSLSVVISFYITERDPKRRMEILQYVQEWAMSGGRLEVDYRAGQFLNVVCETPPVITSANDWKELLTVTFTALEFPYWIDQSRAEITTTGKSSMRPYGLYNRAPCDVVVTNKGSTPVTDLTVEAGETSISFSDISIPAGGKLELTHSEKGVLAARIGDQSVLSKRTDTSSDDLLVAGGRENAISVWANQPVSAVFKAWGVYL